MSPTFNPGDRVTHPEAPEKTGTVLDDTDPAWTPNDLTADAPDHGMVKVAWVDDVAGNLRPPHRQWEYTRELRPAL